MNLTKQKIMKYYDITIPLSENTANWPGAEKYKRVETKTSAITSTITLRSHYATHIDAPKHFVFEKSSVDKIKPELLIGKYKVFEVFSKSIIEIEDIQKFGISAGDRILFKTSNSKINLKPDFTENYVSLGLSVAKYLVQKRILLVGIDYFGIEAKSSPGHPVHKTLLSKNIVIVEGLNLKAVLPGTYQGAILPIKIEGGDGAPARAVLWK